jgi:hypothetical protein
MSNLPLIAFWGWFSSLFDHALPIYYWYQFLFFTNLPFPLAQNNIGSTFGITQLISPSNSSDKTLLQNRDQFIEARYYHVSMLMSC